MRLSRRTLLAATGALCTPARAQPHPLAGQTIDLVITAPDTPASRIAADMAPDFAALAKTRDGYTAQIRFDFLPEPSAFDTMAAALKAQSAVSTLLLIDCHWLDALAAPKWILPLNPLIQARPELDPEWFTPSIPEAFQLYPEAVNNRWAIPQSADVLVLYIRRDQLVAAGEDEAFQKKFGAKLPVSWEEFEQLTWSDCARLFEFFTRPGDNRYGFAAPVAATDPGLTSAAASFIFGSGGEIWHSKGGQVEGVLNTAANAAALDAYKALQRFQPPAGTDVKAAFAEGRLFSALQPLSAAPALIPAALRENVMIVPPPAFAGPGGERRRRYVIGGQSWAINPASDDAHRQLATDFLAWWLTPGTALDFAQRGGAPCDKATLSRDDIDTLQPWFRTYRALLPGAGLLWRDPSFEDLFAIQQQALGDVMSGTADPKRALGAAACRQQSILFHEGTAERQPGPACQDIKPNQ